MRVVAGSPNAQPSSRDGREGTEEQVMNQELKHSVVTKLHQILRPFLLRRLKQDVEIGLPKKYE